MATEIDDDDEDPGEPQALPAIEDNQVRKDARRRIDDIKAAAALEDEFNADNLQFGRDIP